MSRYNAVKLRDNVKLASVTHGEVLAADTAGNTWLYQFDTMDMSVSYTYERVNINEIVSMGMGSAGFHRNCLAVTADGTLWNWGYVIGQPYEHTYPYSLETLEWIEKPTPVNLNDEENRQESKRRMHEKLTAATDEQKRELLSGYFDYYAVNFPEYFTEEMLTEMDEATKNYSSRRKPEAIAFPETQPSTESEPHEVSSELPDVSSEPSSEVPLPHTDQPSGKMGSIAIAAGFIVIICAAGGWIGVKRNKKVK